MITHEEALLYLEYDMETGVFVYKDRDCHEFKTERAYRAWRSRFAHKEAGAPTGHGYLKINLKGGKYYAHRLAWFYVNGEWPPFIDHINGDRADNRIANLRVVTRSENQRNRGVQANNKLGLKGVHKTPNNTFVACITIGGANIHLGCFSSATEAARAYDKAAIQHFGEYARVNGCVPEDRSAA